MISIIVPVYDVEPYIRQCIDSILNQTYKDIEILLIDDGSPDNCGRICDEYAKQDSRIRVFHTENRGLSAARNLGLKEAKGEYIGFVDSDDWIEPDMYEVLLRSLQEEEADISICGYWLEYTDKKSDWQPSKAIYQNKEALKALLEWNIKSNVWNKLYCRDVLQNVTFPDGRYFEDIYFTIHILVQSQKTVVNPVCEYHYRKRQESISSDHSAKSLIDLAEARLFRYEYVRENEPEIFREYQDSLLLNTVKAISRIWCRWHGYSKTEKESCTGNILKLKQFSQTNFPLFGKHSWPIGLRLKAPFLHSNSKICLIVFYYLNQILRKLK